LSDTALLFEPRKFNIRTWQRFKRNRTAELIEHCGGRVSTAQAILIGRIVRNEFDLRRLDVRMMEGDETADAVPLSGHAMRARLAMENRLRLDLRELGLRAAAERPKTYDEVMAELRGRETV
jgi:hypothetical protein